MSLQGSVLIAVILVLRVLLRRRLPRWTFAALWWVALLRLLVPVELPSPVSVYAGLEQAEAVVAQAVPGELPVPHPVESDAPVPAAASSPAPAAKSSPSPWKAVYLTGALAVAVWFLLTWARHWELLRRAVPVGGTTLAAWRCAHPGVAVKVCPGVDAPMACGLLRPVILFPENTDWNQDISLSCALAHEFAHIRRGDLWCKALLSAALSLHWYNPLVWLMARHLGRDLELACDEAVLRRLGQDRRRDYALALLSWAEARNGLSTLCRFNQPELKERIEAIMKLKKTSWAVILAAALLVAVVSVVFATSAAPPENSVSPSGTSPVQGMPLPDPASSPEPSAPSAAASGRVDSFTAAAPASSAAEPPVEDKPETDQPAVFVEEPAAVPKDENPPVEDEPETGQPAAPSETQEQPAAPADPEDRWGVPADPIPNNTIIPLNSEEDYLALRDYLHRVRGVPYDAISAYTVITTDGKQFLRGAVIDVPEIAPLADQEDHWGVPADPIPKDTEMIVNSREEEEKLYKYLWRVRGLRQGDISSVDYHDGRFGVRVTYQESEILEELFALSPDGGFPKNSSGETYGNGIWTNYLGYEPDWVAVVATNGERGYARREDLLWGPGLDYPYYGVDDPPISYTEWVSDQPPYHYVPVFDSEGKTQLGEFELFNSASKQRSQEDIDEEMDLYRLSLEHMGLSDEEIEAYIQKKLKEYGR